MALSGKVTTEKDKGGQDVDVFSAKFTNGTFEQLKELSDFLKKEGVVVGEDPTDVIRVAISVLVSLKENKEKHQPS